MMRPRKSILSVIRKQTRLVKFLVFLLTFSQVYGQAYNLYFNYSAQPSPILKVSHGIAYSAKDIISDEDSPVSNQSNKYSNTLSADGAKKIIGEKGISSRKAVKGTYLAPKIIASSNNDDYKFYISDIKEGIIGKDKEHPIDQIYDNIFNINISEELNSTSTYVLEYDLYGAKDFSQISKVINDDLAVGENKVETTNYWSAQSEPLASTSIRKGINTIIFTLPSSADYSYRVRNVRISLYKDQRKIQKAAKPYVANVVYKSILAGTEGELSISAASLKIDKSSLKETQNFSITPLRDIDIPVLPAEMVNVTKDNVGYRFLPHGEHFSTPAKISMGYDKSKIPAGYTEQDVKTYYFDRFQKKWIALEKEALLSDKQVLVSKTTHFTDMINGVIKVPESPETGSYAPNSIKDIKAANPTEGIVSIAPPTANSMGTVNTSFPIKLPAGRNGMQPSLSINYNSDGGNGWLGLGWDLSIPAVSIDTRWGVPVYGDSDGNGVYDGTNAFETEIYTIGGEQLAFRDGDNYVLPNKTEGFQKLRGTSDTKQFYPRIEGAYNKVIRHGSSPSTYWWEVVSKDGTRSIFGNDGTADDSYVLKDAKGNIGYWALYKTIDTNNNYVLYKYDKLDYNPSENVLGKGGQEYYVKTIEYTLNSSNASLKKYTVSFGYHPEQRSDVQVNARLGFVQVISKRLGKIDVIYDGDKMVRTYALSYKPNAPFSKSLLETITEKGTDGTDFYTNRIDYFDNTAGGIGNYLAKSIGGQVEDITNASILGAGQSSNTSFGFSLGVGVVDMTDFKSSNPTLRSGTVSLDYSYTKDDSRQLLALNDLDGDNLPDKVFYNSGLKYRKNLITPSVYNAFNSTLGVPNGGTMFDKTTGHTNTFGTTLSAGSPISGNVTNSTSTSRSVTENYFTDANGDGITDIVENGNVKFGVVNSTTGVVNYEATSANTPNPINASSFGSIVTPDSQEEATLRKENPLHDVVRVWKAPYTGTVTISNTANLTNAPINGQDGIQIVVQQNNVEASNRITLNGTIPQTFSLSRNVNKGDYIYFRVMSVNNGENDEVNWNSTITYPASSNPNIPQTTDANGLSYNTFNSVESALLTSKSGVGAISTGNAVVTGTFTKPATTDSYRLLAEIYRQGNLLSTSTISDGYIGAGNSATTVSINTTVSVQEGDEVRIVVYSKSNIDWGALSFANLKVTFTDPTDSTKTITIDTVPEYRFYNWIKSGDSSNSTFPISPIKNTLTTPKQFTFYPFLAFNGNSIPNPNKPSVIRFVVKKRNSSGIYDFTGSGEITFSGNNFPSSFTGDSTNFTGINIPQVNPSDEIFYEFYTSDKYLVDALTVAEGFISPSASPTESGIFNNKRGNVYLIDKDDLFMPDGSTTNTETDGRYGSMYRNWGRFSYNGNAPWDSVAIDQSVLLVPTTNGNNDKLYDKRFIQMYISTKNKKYQGVTDLIYTSGNILSSSRMGIANIENVLGLSNPGGIGSGVVAPKRIVKSSSESSSLGIGTPLWSLNNFNGSGTNKTITDYLDLNGDRYPDAVGDKVTYTNMLGAYANTSNLADGLVNRTITNNSGVGTGSNIPIPKKTHTENPNSGDKDSKDKENSSNDAKGSIDVGINFGGGNSTNDDDGEFSLGDINGDGLPDRLYSGGDVRLNLGYSFAPKQNINFSSIRDGHSDTSNLSVGIGVAGSGLLVTGGKTFFNGSISFGGGASQTLSQQNVMFADINGDGLVDKVRYGSGNLYATLNLGNRFDTVENLWATGYAISNSTSRGGSINFSITAGVVIPIPNTNLGAKISFTPSINTGNGDSNTTYEISDIDGDGYPDLLKNTSASTFSNKTLTANVSTIGTTNLIKKVTFPTGGSWEVTYTRLGNTYPMPHSKYVMSSVLVNDGFTGDNSYDVLTSKNTFDYTNGYYSRKERTFYGFETVKTTQVDTSTNTPYRYTLQTFNNSSYYLKGALLNETLYSYTGNTKWTEKANTYELRKIHDTDVLNTNLVQVKEQEKLNTDYACFLALKQAESKFYEGQTAAGKTTKTVISSYDQWGNVATVTDYGDLDIGASEVLTSSVTYSDVTSGKYVIAPTSVSSTASNVARSRTASYDPVTGDLKSITIVGNAGNSTYDFEYDVYGNLTKSTGPVNYNSQRFYNLYTYDTNVQTYPVKVEDVFGYASKTSYDFRFGVPLYTEDMNLQPMAYAYDNFGRTTTITGPYEMFNNIPWTIRFTYSPITNAPTNGANTVITAQSYAKTEHYDPENVGNYITTITIADGLGTPIQVKKTGAIYNNSITDLDQYIVAGKVAQDAFGRALKTYYPTTEAIGTSNVLYNVSVDTVTPTVNTYDILDRVTSTKLPGEDLIATIQYGFNNDKLTRKMFETVFTDELGTVKKTYTDIKGRTTTVKEPSNTGDIITSFTHDALGNILKVEDVAGNLTESVYDNLGRRVSYKHPDSGITTYEYDTASNLRYKTNSANEKVEYLYDYTRLSEVKYPKFTENNVKYYYGKAKDASAMDNNAVGRLWYQTDATGSQYLKYGRLGELTYQRRSVAVPGSGVYWFGTEWQYDTWNRVKSIIYPDGEKVTYSYNKAGNLKSMKSLKEGNVQSIVNNLGYDKFEQRVYLEYGNGTKTTYEYETERRRLLKLNAQTRAIKGKYRYFMQNVYQYDAVSNVLQIHNNAPFAPAGLIGGATNHAFGYDDLYRLTSASGNWRGVISHLTGYNTDGSPIYQDTEERNRYTVSMAYDNMHNVTRKEQKHERSIGNTGNVWDNVDATSYRLNYRYQGSKPHAPSTIIEEPNRVPTSACCNPDDPETNFANYSYDAKGNTIGIEKNTCSVQEDDRIFLWDEENRLRFVDTNPSTPQVDGAAIYTYDAGGERIIKDFLFSSTVNVNYANLSSLVTSPSQHKTTIYPNGLISMDLEFQGGDLYDGTYIPRYTKHYYAGSQRISSKIGAGKFAGQFNCAWLIIPFGGGSAPISEKAVAKEKLDANTQASLKIMQTNGITPPPGYGQNAGYNEDCVSSYAGDLEQDVYWYHPDHLGSSSFITDLGGEVTQSIEYFPSGEVFVENHKNDNLNSPYKFNGKELDAETGYYYYGARYYNPRTSIWMSVDPLADYNPFYNTQHYIDGQHNGGVYNSGNLNPYIYCYQSPTEFIDPNGKQVFYLRSRSFAPFNSFGGGFEGDGDNRKFTTGELVTSRISILATVDINKGTYEVINGCSRSDWFGLSFSKAHSPTKSDWAGVSDSKGGYYIHMYGKNKALLWGLVSPDIDVNISFNISNVKKGESFDISGKVFGDGFPSNETFIQDFSGNSIFLGVSGANGSPFTSLAGDNDKPMSSFRFKVLLNKDNTFKGVRYRGKNYSLSQWNAQFEKLKPKDGNTQSGKSAE